METSTCSYLSDITRENPFKFFVKSELSSVVCCSPQWPRLWRCPNDWYGPATSASPFLAEPKSPKVWFDDNRERRARSSQHTRSVFLPAHRIILACRWSTTQHQRTQLTDSATQCTIKTQCSTEEVCARNTDASRTHREEKQIVREKSRTQEEDKVAWLLQWQ